MLLVLESSLIGLWIKVLKIPYRICSLSIFLFCTDWVLQHEHSIFDVYVMLVLAGSSATCSASSITSRPPLVLAFILGPCWKRPPPVSAHVPGELWDYSFPPFSAATLALTFLVSRFPASDLEEAKGSHKPDRGRLGGGETVTWFWLGSQVGGTGGFSAKGWRKRALPPERVLIKKIIRM